MDQRRKQHCEVLTSASSKASSSSLASLLGLILLLLLSEQRLPSCCDCEVRSGLLPRFPVCFRLLQWPTPMWVGVGVEVERMLRPLRLCAFLCLGRGPPHDAAAGHVSRGVREPSGFGPTRQRPGPGSPVSFLGPWSRRLCCRCFFRPPSRGGSCPAHLL